MTRINCVPVEELSDQHLFAEWREIKHLPPSMWTAWLKHGDAAPGRAGKTYTLGKGHVLFFHDKGLWLAARYGFLSAELMERGVGPSALVHLRERDTFTGRLQRLPPSMLGGWTPSAPEEEAALALNRTRLAQRLAARPSWYRWSLRPRPEYAP
jgi:deoxyribonuclease (pyrimidine dimer)